VKNAKRALETKKEWNNHNKLYNKKAHNKRISQSELVSIVQSNQLQGNRL
jgi:hypothetical protein